MCVWPFGVIVIVVGRVGGGGRGVLPFFALGEGRGVGEDEVMCVGILYRIGLVESVGCDE